MNEHDSFRMARILGSMGYEMTADVSAADLILVNTCSVRHNPENKVFSFLGALKPLKKCNPDLIVGVAGCVARRAGQEILKRSSVVDMVFGPDNYFRLPEMVSAVRGGERVVMTDWLPGHDRVQNFIPEEWIGQGHVENGKAYVAISKGCNNFCSFCIVPSVRGREVCREPDNILREAQDLVEKGAREIWLLGQNVNSYRAGDWGFRELLDALSRLDIRRIRFTSPHPKDWTNDLADLMAARDNICSYLHLPLQAGSDRMLKLMRRRHTLKEYMDKLDYARSRVPGIEVSTDLIVGYPTETDAEFEDTLRAMEHARYSQIFSFKYSPRPGTKAGEQPDDVPREVKEDRLARLIALQEQITAQDLSRYAGSEQEVMVEGRHPKKPGVWNGRSDGFRPVSFNASSVAPGDFVRVRITGSRDHWLLGELT